MAGLLRQGVEASPFGSKFKDTDGGYDAGNGKRTYTKPSFTLFVTKIPDAEGSDAVTKVFEKDEGLLQCRPKDKKGRRMMFVDYETIAAATKGMQAHQGHKWEDVDDGLKIDYDKDARSKRNTAMDEGNYERFFPIGPRKAKVESDTDLFARLKAESQGEVEKPAAPSRSLFAAAEKAEKKRIGVGARFQIKGKGSAAPAKAEAGEASAVAPPEKPAEEEGASSALPQQDSSHESEAPAGLVGYGSDSDGSEEEEEDDDEEAEPNAAKRFKAA